MACGGHFVFEREKNPRRAGSGEKFLDILDKIPLPMVPNMLVLEFLPGIFLLRPDYNLFVTVGFFDKYPPTRFIAKSVRWG